MVHMHPNLMSAPRLKICPEQRKLPETTQDPPVGHRLSSIRHHRHAFPIHMVAANGSVHRTFLLAQIAFHQRKVGTAGSMGFDLC